MKQIIGLKRDFGNGMPNTSYSPDELHVDRGWAEIDLGAAVENMRAMKRNIASGTRMIAVIKTDAYGHGSVPMARALEPLDFLWGFAVATAEEAFELREHGITKPILILGYTFPYSYERLAAQEIRPAVFRTDTLEQLAEIGHRAHRPVRVHIKVDTGMGRIGVRPDADGVAFLEKAAAYERAGELEIEGMFTHFARADEADKTSALMQLQRYTDFVATAETILGHRLSVRHCSNSAGILELPQANFDVVRAGITLYGLMPSDEVRTDIVPLRPVLSIYSHITYVKTIHAGQSVSYGGTFTATRDTRVATIPLGYGDGYPRSLSNKGYVLIRGRRAPILGRVCMDQFMVDVTAIPGACEGDLVTLLGTDGSETITAETLGTLSGRFNYELVCDLSPRVPRVYTRNV